MKRKGIFLSMALAFANVALVVAQQPFTKGVNLTNWFQANGARQIQFTKFAKKDFQNIKSLGCDVIRLPINLHAMTSGEPDYLLDPLFLNFLDQAVNWSEELGLNLILDNHSFDPAASTQPSIENILVKVWPQMAEHYKDRSNHIYYEVLNEPHGIDDATWGTIQQAAIDAIRTKDTKHFIVVGPANWNSYNNLNNVPHYSDTKLIYTFHFYDPFIFTHQGASWTDPSLVPLSGVPFPYQALAMPAIPAPLQGTWIEGSLANYSNDGTVNKVKELIDIAVGFKKNRNVTLFCGEFGVCIPNSNASDRVAWYSMVQHYLTEKGIPWTIWDYTGGFGLFRKDSNELFDYDLNVPLLEALEFNVPVQKVYQKKPATTGFIMYGDFLGEGISDASTQGDGTLDFYSTTDPEADNYCIYWTGVGQYDAMGFDFKPDLDLSLLPDHKFALDFWVQGNSPEAKFDIRFIDTKANHDDHPWRMGMTIDNTVATWDGSWHHVTIPLKALEEKGSWDNAWFDPAGKFDWSAVDRFEIVPESQPLTGIEFSFDNIQVSGEAFNLVTGVREPVDDFGFRVHPNPLRDHTHIEYAVSHSDNITIGIYNLQGQRVKSIITHPESAGNYAVMWNGIDDNGYFVANGMYLVRLDSRTKSQTGKLLVLGY